MSLLSVDKLYYSLPTGEQLLDNVSFTLSDGEIAILVGKSGAGKSELLKIIYGLSEPLAGEIIFKGVSVELLKMKKYRTIARKIGYVPQEGVLIPDRTIGQNLEFFLGLFDFSGRALEDKKISILTETGLLQFAAKKVNSLSNFERQKLKLSLGLINDPDLLLVDSPTSELEPHSADQIAQFLLKLNKKGTALIVATNNFEFAKNLNGKILLLEEQKIKAVN